MKTVHIYLIVGLLSFLLYANTITHEYTWDDQIVITQNNVTTKGAAGLFEIWTTKNYIQDRPTYRPIPQTLHALEWQLFPNTPIVGHMTTIMVYVLCVLSFLFVLKHFFPDLNNWLILFIGLMFSLLPVHTEVVANIKSVDEILSALFVLWSVYYASKKGWKCVTLSLLFLIAAILSKVSAITALPFIVFFIKPQYSFFKKIFDFLIKHYNSILILFSLILIALSFDYSSGLALIITLALIFNLSKQKASLVNYIFIALSAFLIVYLGKSTYLFLLLGYFFIVNNISLYNKKYLPFIVLYIIIIGLLSEVELFYFIPLLNFIVCIYFYKKEGLKSIKTIIFIAFSILFIVFFMIYQSEIKVSYIVSAFGPLIIILLYHYLPKIVLPLIILFIFSDHFYDLSDSLIYHFNQVSFENEIVTPKEVLKDDFEKQILINQPYHNVLVAANDLSEKSATICRIQLVYLQKLLFPIHLVHQHGTRQIELASWKDWDVYLSIIIHLILVGGIYYFFKKKNFLVVVGIVWYFITMSIYTNIVRLMPDTLAERFLFLPSFGFTVAFIGALFYFLNKIVKSEKRTYQVMTGLLFPLFIYYAYKTVDRNKDWKNNYTLAANTLPHALNNATINAQYALEVNNLIKYNLVENKDSAQALVLKHYQKAIDIFPDFYGPQSDMAVYYILQAEPNKAFPYMLEAIRIKPDEWIHHYYLGLIYYERKKYNEAIERFNSVETNRFVNKNPLSNPELLAAYEYEARCLHNLGKDDQAIIELEKAIEIFNQKSTYILLGNLLRTIGKQDAAIEVFERLLIQTPEDQELINTIQLIKERKIY